MLPFQVRVGTLVVAAAVGACVSRAPVNEVRAKGGLVPVATIEELMEGQIDPAADALWDSVAVVVNEAGTVERQPRTDEDWRAVRLQALTLIEATNLLGLSGRRLGTATTPPGPGELPPAERQRRIDQNPDAFAGYAAVLRAAAQDALSAIEARDPQRLMDAGGAIDTACEACHVAYWYPGQAPAGR